MTKAIKNEIKRNAQKAMKENGLKVFQKDMILLECGYAHRREYGLDFVDVDYVMFEDSKTGKQFQCYYGANYYNHEKNTLWYVEEYVAQTTPHPTR